MYQIHIHIYEYVCILYVHMCANNDYIVDSEEYMLTMIMYAAGTVYNS